MTSNGQIPLIVRRANPVQPGRATAIPRSLMFDPTISARAFRLWVLLADENEPVRQAEIANILGCSRDTVRRAAQELEAAGYLIIENSGIPGRQSGNVYQTVTPD